MYKNKSRMLQLPYTYVAQYLNMNSFPMVNQNIPMMSQPHFSMFSQQPGGVPPMQQQYWQPVMMGSMPSSAPIPFTKKRNAEQMEDRITLGGKWTAEEEAYAAVLIQHFRTGALQDCEDGTTLRSYLAEKLECIPMRISKKFAGIKIGKEIFRRGPTSAEVAMQLNYIRELFVQSTSKKRKRIKRKMMKAAQAKSDVPADNNTTDIEVSPHCQEGVAHDVSVPAEICIVGVKGTADEADDSCSSSMCSSTQSASKDAL